jgi:hypothetical protein
METTNNADFSNLEHAAHFEAILAEANKKKAD